MNHAPDRKPARRLVQIRLDPAVVDRLKVGAAQDGRTLNGLLVKVCTDLANGLQSAGQPQSTPVAPRGAVQLNA